MSKGYQTFPATLRSVTVPPGGGGSDVVSFDPLPATLLGGIAHVESIDFHVSFTPTDAGGSTLTPLEQQALVTRLTIRDGLNERFNGSFALLRFAEMLQKGRLVTPDADTLATTEAGYFVRRWTPGPIGFAGDPSDFLLPVAALKSGAIEFGFGSLADLDNIDSLVAEIRTVVNLVPLYGEFRIPPLARWTYGDAGAADVNIPGRALHHTLALFNDAAYGAIGAGDFANVTVIGAGGVLVPAIHAADLARSFLARKAGGHITPIQGEPRAATDDNAKVVNPGTPTALVAASANVNPVLSYSEGQMISKLRAYAESQLRLQWTGSQATGRWLSGRIEAFGAAQRGAMANKVLSGLGMTALGGPKVKTLSKDAYKGDLLDFMPTAVKVR